MRLSTKLIGGCAICRSNGCCVGCRGSQVPFAVRFASMPDGRHQNPKRNPQELVRVIKNRHANAEPFALVAGTVRWWWGTSSPRGRLIFKPNDSKLIARARKVPQGSSYSCRLDGLSAHTSCPLKSPTCARGLRLPDGCRHRPRGRLHEILDFSRRRCGIPCRRFDLRAVNHDRHRCGYLDSSGHH